jgi:hypothetical protein
MKKITLSLTLFLLCKTQWAQEVYHAYQAGVATYSQEFQKWIFEKPNHTDLTFVFQQGVMSVTDNKRSTYVLGEKIESERKANVGMLSWDAMDEEGTACIVKVLFYRFGPVRVEIVVMYGTSSYYFFTNRVGP